MVLINRYFDLGIPLGYFFIRCIIKVLTFSSIEKVFLNNKKFILSNKSFICSKHSNGS